MVENPPRVDAPETGALQDFLQLKDLLKLRLLWPMFPLMVVSYAPAAGFRGLWIAPYLSEVYQADSATIGFASSLMACTMIPGVLLYGPADRVFKTRKWVIIIGNSIRALSCFGLFLVPAAELLPSIVLFGFVGFFGMSFPMLMAHGRSFAPVRLTRAGGHVVQFAVYRRGWHFAICHWPSACRDFASGFAIYRNLPADLLVLQRVIDGWGSVLSIRSRPSGLIALNCVRLWGVFDRLQGCITRNLIYVRTGQH